MLEWPLHRVQIGELPLPITNAPMDNQDALSNDGAKGQVLKAPRDAGENISAFIVTKSLHACLLKAMRAHESVLRLILMIPAIQEHLVGERQLQCVDHKDCFNLMGASVNPITIENKVRSAWSGISVMVQVQKEISKLPVEVAINLCWRRASVDDRFLCHYTLQAYGQLLDEWNLPALLTFAKQHLQDRFPCRSRPDVAHYVRLMRHCVRHMQGHLHNAIGQLVVATWPCTTTAAR
mmetsp:Transcript_66688/g.124560  ORF Transcript_66688/g.124560 Transcript_66688/m.124560 type:complete len:236 (-) Transcript_66688:240-947(-)